MLRSLEQFIQTVKIQNNNRNRILFYLLLLEVSQILYIRTIRMPIGANNLDEETYRTSCVQKLKEPTFSFEKLTQTQIFLVVLVIQKAINCRISFLHREEFTQPQVTNQSENWIQNLTFNFGHLATN